MNPVIASRVGKCGDTGEHLYKCLRLRKTQMVRPGTCRKNYGNLACCSRKSAMVISPPIAALSQHRTEMCRHSALHDESLDTRPKRRRFPGKLQQDERPVFPQPVGSLRQSSVNSCGDDLKEPLQTTVEAVQVQSYAVQVEVVGEPLSSIPAFLGTLGYTFQFVQFIGDPLCQFENPFIHRSIPSRSIDCCTDSRQLSGSTRSTWKSWLMPVTTATAL